MSAVDSSDFLNRISSFTSHHLTSHVTPSYISHHTILHLTSHLTSQSSLTYRVPAVSGEEDGVMTQYVDVLSLLPHPRDL